MIGATLLTAFNDNAAVTFLASTVPNLPEAVKYSVVAGAVTGGRPDGDRQRPQPGGAGHSGQILQGNQSPVAVHVGGPPHGDRVHLLHLFRPLNAES